MLASIMQKNLTIYQNISFWKIKEESDSNKKHSAKKLKGSIGGVSTNTPYYKSIIIPRLDIT